MTEQKIKTNKISNVGNMLQRLGKIGINDLSMTCWCAWKPAMYWTRKECLYRYYIRTI